MRFLFRHAALISLALLCGCSSLQTIVPDLSPRARPPVQLDGTRGPLSAERSKAIIDKLKSSGTPTAETEVWLTNAYFVPDPQLIAALKAAVKRGVVVRLVLPSSNDSWLVFHAGRAHLLKADVKLYERHGALLHVKAAVIDDVWSTVGSANLDWRSFLHNYELNAVVLGNGCGDKMRAAFKEDLAQSNPITLTTWQRRSLAVRTKELIGRLWEYWL